MVLYLLEHVTDLKLYLPSVDFSVRGWITFVDDFFRLDIQSNAYSAKITNHRLKFYGHLIIWASLCTVLNCILSSPDDQKVF